MRVFLLATILLFLAATCDLAEAATPEYLLLRTPVSGTPRHPVEGRQTGFATPVRARAYSYGWFGVKPRRHWTRHTGYYRTFTQWSAN